MASDTELDALVEEAIGVLNGRGDKVTSHSVKKLVKHRTEDVLRAYRRIMAKQKAEKEAELSRAISPGIAAEVITDRDAYSEAKTQILREEVEQLLDVCEILNEEIAELRNELAEGQELSEKRQTAMTEQINELQLIKTEQEGEVNSLLGEIRVLRNDRDTARKERSDIEVKLSGLKQTLALKASDERRERTRAKNLQANLDKTVLENEQFRETNEALIKTVRTIQDQIEMEHVERTEAENKLIATEAEINGLRAEIQKLQKKKTSTENK